MPSGSWCIGLALTGVIIGVYRRPGQDGPLAAIALCSMLAVSTHFRFVGRYYFQVLPWIVYFATVAVLEVVLAGAPLVALARRSASRARAWR